MDNSKDKNETRQAPKNAGREVDPELTTEALENTLEIARRDGDLEGIRACESLINSRHEDDLCLAAFDPNNRLPLPHIEADIEADSRRMAQRLKDAETEKKSRAGSRGDPEPAHDALKLNALDFDHVRNIDFVLDRILERKAISILFGKPGSGKSTLAIAEIMTICTGVDFLQLGLSESGPENPGRVSRGNPGKVGIFWSDEGLNNLLAKAAALCKRYDLDASVAQSNMTAIGNFNLVLNADNCLETADRAIEEWGELDAVYIDSISTLAPTMEMRNDDASRIMKALERIAWEADIAIRILGHPRKGPIGETEQGMEGLRGASAVLGRASIVEQLIHWYEDGTQYMSIGGAGELKYRNSPHPERRAYRIQSMSIDVDNGTANRSMPVIAVHEEPALQDPFSDISMHDCEKIMDALQKAPPEERRADVRASGWVGYLIADCLELDCGGRSSKERNGAHEAARQKIMSMTSAWLKGGVLKTRKQKIETDPRKRKFDVVSIGEGLPKHGGDIGENDR